MGKKEQDYNLTNVERAKITGKSTDVTVTSHEHLTAKIIGWCQFPRCMAIH
jgi:hypothetical protein